MDTLKKRSLLLPYRYQIIGWCLIAFVFVSFVLLLIALHSWEIIPHEYGRYVLSTEALLVCIAALLVGFSKEKKEDEFIAYIRMRSIIITVCAIFLFYLVGGGILSFDNAFRDVFQNDDIHEFVRIFRTLTSVQFAFPLYICVFKISLFIYWRKSKRNEE